MSGIPSFPKDNPIYPHRKIENEIDNHAKASKNPDLDRAIYRPVSGLFFYPNRTEHATLLQINTKKIPVKSSILALYGFLKERRKNGKR